MPTFTKTQSALATLDALTCAYVEARRITARRLAVLQEEIAAARRRLLPHIKSAAVRAADLQSELRAEIERHPELFEKPRTMTLHGIKIGFQKGKGKITWDDPSKVVHRIDVVLDPDHLQREQLIEITETPRKEALMQLDTATLKKLGCTITDTGDSIIVKAADTEIDKLVARLLEEGAEAVEAGKDA